MSAAAYPVMLDVARLRVLVVVVVTYAGFAMLLSARRDAAAKR